MQNAGSYREIETKALRAWLESLVRELAPSADTVGLRFNGHRAMRGMNRSFRGLDYATDVLSFPGTVNEEGVHLGDIVICVPVARCQAEAAGHGLARELRVLALHGVLHCLGYDHERDEGEMETLEGELRKQWLSEK